MAFLRGDYHQSLGPRRHLAKFANGLCRHSNVWVDLDPHLNWQATKSDVKRGNAFGLISHKFLPYCLVHDRRLPETAYNLSALLKAPANYNSKIYTQKFCRVI